jgi:5-oxoprolinase (ATP-hydrolysing)
VAGGNVETSQRVVDVLLGALGRLAACQGTMNNLTFGDAHFGYYETVGGGAGAGPGFDGASGVHTHMTNTRITDPEVLEARFPVRLVEFGLRPDSGGAGRRRGGDGVVREIEFLAPMRVSLLSERRARAPFGLAGGEPGKPGRNLVNGRDVGGKGSFEVEAGGRVRIETPGGGGYGA